MTYMMAATALALLLMIVGASAHTYHLGECPNVEPMQGFQMNKFLGKWYVIQKTSTASTCLVYNFTRGSEPDQYLLEQKSDNFVFPGKDEHHYTGTLTVPDPSVPAKMEASFPLNFIGKAQYTVLNTDYETFGGIFSCQKIAFGHRQSVSIVSRTKYLDKNFIDKIRLKLASFNIDSYDLSILSQKDCPEYDPNRPETINVKIDDKTFSAKNIGQKISNGFDYLAQGAKKIFTSGEDDSKEAVENVDKRFKASQSEWLP